MPVLIREVRLQDYSGIAAVRAESLGVPPAKLIAKFKTEVERGIAADTWKMFVAVEGDFIAGYGRCEFYDSQRDDSLYGTKEKLPSGWYLRGIVVAKEFQRKGIAALLTKARIDWIESKTSEIYCFLDSDEKVALPTYLDLGFREISRNWKFENIERADSGILLFRS